MAAELDLCDLLIAVSRMPEDRRSLRPKEWFESQKEHWVGWLFHYNSAGAYGRKTTSGRDARFVYNHVVNPGLLLYLAEASGVEGKIVRSARRAASMKVGMAAQSGAIRRAIPWDIVFDAMCRNGYLSDRSKPQDA